MPAWGEWAYKEKVLSHYLMDRHGRRVSYLRISLTEKCNFRCLYCMPPEGAACLPSSDYLSADEIARFATAACRMGIKRVRLTGGEPTLRAEIVDIVTKLARVPGLSDLAMTTNGSKLKNLALPLAQAGLKRINISLDSLNPATFARLSLRDEFDATRDGILAALSANLPVKINTVVMRGINDGEIEDFIEFAFANPLEEVRFIEFMPLCGTGWKPELVRPFPGIIAELKSKYGMERIAQPADDVAQSFLVRKNGKTARIGFITTLSEPFCGSCSRMRLTADGVLRPCLFSHQGTPMRGLLRGNAPEEELAAAIRRAVWDKSRGNGFYAANESGRSLDDYMTRQMGGEENPSIRAIGG